jgi:hypothetical protein
MDALQVIEQTDVPYISAKIGRKNFLGWCRNTNYVCKRENVSWINKRDSDGCPCRWQIFSEDTGKIPEFVQNLIVQKCNSLRRNESHRLVRRVIVLSSLSHEIEKIFL